ncbi:uncharacterized protein [Bemisia tabaci]|uniref:uncharacterized protein n=1 Tax=Bemisia tabaci TaxID=7038 RepID=UPI003B27BBF6
MEANSSQITLLLGVLGFFGTVECPSAMVAPIISEDQLQYVSDSIIKSERWDKIARKQPRLSASTSSKEYMKSISRSPSVKLGRSGSGSGSSFNSFKYNDDFMSVGSDSDSESLSVDKSPSRSSSDGNPSLRDYKSPVILGEVTKVYGRINLDQTNKGSCRVNAYLKKHNKYDGDPRMKLDKFRSIVEGMWEAVANDDCKVNSGISWTGDGECQKIYGQFKQIPAELRGICSTAIKAQCSVVPCQAKPLTHQTACSFYVPTYLMRWDSRESRKSREVDGAFIPLQDCVRDMKKQLAEQLKLNQAQDKVC